MSQLIKICGISTLPALDAALEAGADMIGLVRFPKSPRHVAIEQGRALARRAKGRALRVVLVVDATDSELSEAVEALDPDLLQLHGSESPERVAAIRARFGRPVAKAIGIAEAADLEGIEAFREVADRLVLDAKPPRADGALPGGNGQPFEWRLLRGLDRDVGFMLSGGLSPDNVEAAIQATGAAGVDVSSGVERAPGDKEAALIEAFVTAARRAWAAQNQKDTAA